MSPPLIFPCCAHCEHEAIGGRHELPCPMCAAEAGNFDPSTQPPVIVIRFYCCDHTCPDRFRGDHADLAMDVPCDRPECVGAIPVNVLMDPLEVAA